MDETSNKNSFDISLALDEKRSGEVIYRHVEGREINIFIKIRGRWGCAKIEFGSKRNIAQDFNAERK